MAYEGIDAASLELIIKLQLSDVKRLTKGKGKEGDARRGTRSRHVRIRARVGSALSL